MTTQHHSIDQLVDALSALSVLDMSKLKSALEDKWGVKAAAAAPMMMAGPVAAAAPAVESTEFKIILESSSDDKKISVIKVVREITGLGLKEAKDLVEGAPKDLKTASKAEADEIAKKITTAGGKVTLKGL
jgi:large subunit ribosomal protein L7/L12